MALQTKYLEFGSETIPHYFLCNYRPVSVGLDALSKSLLNFKCGYRPDTTAWIECSLVELKKVQIENQSLVLRALASRELNATSNMTLDRLGNELAENKLLLYQPNMLTKTRITQQVKLLSNFEREKELANAYLFEPPRSYQPNQILILDDILTTGATMRSIITSIRAVLSSVTVKIFTLASTDHDAIVNKTVQLHGYKYGWENDRGWIAAEDPAEFTVDADALKYKILNDHFY